jgi:hypothetical protein
MLLARRGFLLLPLFSLGWFALEASAEAGKSLREVEK